MNRFFDYVCGPFIKKGEFYEKVFIYVGIRIANVFCVMLKRRG